MKHNPWVVVKSAVSLDKWFLYRRFGSTVYQSRNGRDVSFLTEWSAKRRAEFLNSRERNEKK